MDVVRLTELREQDTLRILRHIRIIHIQAQLLGQLFRVTHTVLLRQLLSVLTPAGNGLTGKVKALFIIELTIQRLARKSIFGPLVLRDAAEIFYDHAYRAYRVMGHLAITGALLAKQAVGNGFE